MNTKAPPFGGAPAEAGEGEKSSFLMEVHRSNGSMNKFVDVIVKRYAEQVGGTDGFTVIRDEVKYGYEEVSV